MKDINVKITRGKFLKLTDSLDFNAETSGVSDTCDKQAS